MSIKKRWGLINIGQQEIVDFLKECDKPVTRKEIADGINQNPIRVSHIIRKLLKWKDIKFIEHDRNEASKLVGYMLERRTRFYYIE